MFTSEHFWKLPVLTPTNILPKTKIQRWNPILTQLHSLHKTMMQKSKEYSFRVLKALLHLLSLLMLKINTVSQ